MSIGKINTPESYIPCSPSQQVGEFPFPSQPMVVPRRALSVLRMRQLIQRTGLPRSSVYNLISKDPTFPRKIQLSARSVGFFEHEVEAWLALRSVT
jgi:predicted DNA-binding transcriptional regulator AlpA